MRRGKWKGGRETEPASKTNRESICCQDQQGEGEASRAREIEVSSLSSYGKFIVRAIRKKKKTRKWEKRDGGGPDQRLLLLSQAAGQGKEARG